MVQFLIVSLQRYIKSVTRQTVSREKTIPAYLKQGWRFLLTIQNFTYYDKVKFEYRKGTSNP